MNLVKKIVLLSLILVMLSSSFAGKGLVTDDLSLARSVERENGVAHLPLANSFERENEVVHLPLANSTIFI